MKLLSSLLFVAIIVFLFSACRKKESAAPAAASAIDTTVNVDSVKQVAFKSYTDTFIGHLQNYVYGPPDFTNDDASFIFYVRHLSAHTIIFQNTKALQLNANSSDALIFDFQAEIDSLNTYIYDPYASSDEEFIFSLSNDNLTLSWDYGVNCWDMEYKGIYNGKKSNPSTTIVPQGTRHH